MATQIIYVQQNAGGNNDGTSWKNAYTDLQTALGNTTQESEIWVAKGIYKPTSNEQRESSFFLRDQVNLYGGFLGNEITIDQRNWQENQTILSGDIGLKNEQSDNSYNVVTVLGTSQQKTVTRLDGFTIKDGNADHGAGGGIYISNSQIILANLTLVSNQASLGGAIYNTFASVTVFATNIYDNIAIEDGGGIYNYKSDLNLTNTILSNNQAGNLGGGLTIDTSKNVNLTNVLLNNNTADNGGGIYNRHSSSSLINVTLSNNVATTDGGIESLYGDSKINIVNSIFWGNQATSIANPTTSQISNIQDAVTQVRNSIVEGAYGNPEDQNLALDPLFLNAESGNFSLQNTSPAIDRGNNLAVPIAITFDLDNNPRISNEIVDLGAYEFISEQNISFRFDLTSYGASHPDLIVALGYNLDALYHHYLQYGQFEGRSLDNFDEYRYIVSYDDLIDRFGNEPAAATIHYITDGFSEHRDPSLFEPACYLASYDDLIQSYGYNLEAGIAHYLNYGRTEGRSRCLFDSSRYLERYPDLQMVYGNNPTALASHYLEYGVAEGRNWM